MALVVTYIMSVLQIQYHHHVKGGSIGTLHNGSYSVYQNKDYPFLKAHCSNFSQLSQLIDLNICM